MMFMWVFRLFSIRLWVRGNWEFLCLVVLWVAIVHVTLCVIGQGQCCCYKVAIGKVLIVVAIMVLLIVLSFTVAVDIEVLSNTQVF